MIFTWPFSAASVPNPIYPSIDAKILFYITVVQVIVRRNPMSDAFEAYTLSIISITRFSRSVKWRFPM